MQVFYCDMCSNGPQGHILASYTVQTHVSIQKVLSRKDEHTCIDHIGQTILERFNVDNAIVVRKIPGQY